MKRVFIQYNCIAHYRTRVFELLSQNKEFEFSIIADESPDIPFLKTFDASSGRFIRQKISKNLTLKLPFIPDIYFQPNTLLTIYKERPNCIISLGTIYSLTSWLTLILAKALGIPRIIWGHGLLEEEKGLKWLIRKSFYMLADAQLLYGHHAKELLINKGFDSTRLFVVYNSLDYDNQVKIEASISKQQINDFKNKLKLTDKSKMLIFTGRLQPVKRLDQLILATAKLNHRGKDVHLTLIGEGEQKQALTQLAIDNEILDKVHFLGAIYDEQVIGLAFKSSDFCVIPSGAGLTIMHSLVYGIPVILSNNLSEHFPEWEAIKEGKTGFYYKSGDIDAMTNTIERALYSIDKKEMSKNCQEIIHEKYNPYIQEKIFTSAASQVINELTRI